MSDLHPGPCEYDGGYGEGGAKVVCTRCLNAIRASKRVGIFDAFLRYAVDTCVNPGLPSLEVLPPGAAVCSRCGAEVRLEGFCAECEEGRDGTGP